MSAPRFAYYAMLLFIFALVIAIGVSRAAVPSTAITPTLTQEAEITAGQLFEGMDDKGRATVEGICELSLDAWFKGDKHWLENYFNRTPKTPLNMRLLVTKMCVTYGAGVQKGMDVAKGIVAETLK